MDSNSSNYGRLSIIKQSSTGFKTVHPKYKLATATRERNESTRWERDKSLILQFSDHNLNEIKLYLTCGWKSHKVLILKGGLRFDQLQFFVAWFSYTLKSNQKTFWLSTSSVLFRILLEHMVFFKNNSQHTLRLMSSQSHIQHNMSRT